MIKMIKWNELILVDGEGFEVKGDARIAALKEFKETNGIHQVFVQHDDQDIEDPKEIDWTGFGQENKLNLISWDRETGNSKIEIGAEEMKIIGHSLMAEKNRLKTRLDKELESSKESDPFAWVNEIFDSTGEGRKDTIKILRKKIAQIEEMIKFFN